MSRLLRVELLRLRSRRALPWLTLAVLGLVVLIGIQAIRTATEVPGTADWVFAEKMVEAASIVAVLLSVYGFVLGATFAGADWAAGTVQSLLTWEPRRVRVIAAKVLALAAVLVLVGVLLHIVLGAFCALASDRGGTFAGMDGDFWGDLAVAAGRALLLGVAIGSLSFGIASLTRNTGAALGVGFVYFAILENLLRVVAPWSNRYLITNAIAVWVEGPMRVNTSPTESFMYTRPTAAVVLAVYSLGVVSVMTAMFARRDVT